MTTVRERTPVMREIQGEPVSMAPAASMAPELIEPFTSSGGCWGCGAEPVNGHYCERCAEEITALKEMGISPRESYAVEWIFIYCMIGGFLILCVLLAGLARWIFG